MKKNLDAVSYHCPHLVLFFDRMGPGRDVQTKEREHLPTTQPLW